MPRAPKTAPPRGGPAAGRVYGGVQGAERRAERRGRFLDAGVVTFGRNGFAGTTTRSLCAEAGLTQRYFYESFGSVEQLFEEVAARLGGELEARLLAAVERAERQPELRLRAVLTAYFESMRADVHAARILLAEVYTAGARSGTLAFQFTAHLADLLRTQLEGELPHLRGKGIDARLVATGLVGATHHIALKWMIGGYREPLTTVVATTLRIYLGAAPAASARHASRARGGSRPSQGGKPQ